jgi:hypothetical protein
MGHHHINGNVMTGIYLILYGVAAILISYFAVWVTSAKNGRKNGRK